MNVWTLSFDGAISKNPGGTASYGFVLKKDGELIDSDHGIIGTGPHLSCNVSEHVAVGKGMDCFIKHFVKPNSSDLCFLQIRGDSRLVIEQLRGNFKARANKLYYPEYVKNKTRIWEIKKLGVCVTADWIPREHNTECDELSKIDRPAKVKKKPLSEAIKVTNKLAKKHHEYVPSSKLKELIEILGKEL